MSVDLPELKTDSKEKEQFNQKAAMGIAIVAMFLAIAGLNGNNAAEDAIYNNIQASDTWAFYQAKNIRQTDYMLAKTELELTLETSSVSADTRSKIERLIADYTAKIASYKSEPSTGEGKDELFKKANDFEDARELSLRKDAKFDMAETFLQIGIVLGSVAIIAYSRWLLATGGIVSVAGVVYLVMGLLLK